MTDVVRRGAMTPRRASFLRRSRREFAAVLFLAGAILLFGAAVGALTGDPKGDDAYLHLSRVQLVLEDFPHLSWFRQWFAGLPLFDTLPFVYYLGLAGAHLVTGISLKGLLVASAALAVVLTGVAVYFLGRKVGLPELFAIPFALLFVANPAVWNVYLTGGAYVRVVALPFVFLSVGLAYLHLRKVDRGDNPRYVYLGTVLSLALIAIIHPLLAQFTFIIVTLLYLIGIRSWRQKVATLAQVMVPVGLLVAWQYLPLVDARILSSSSGGIPLHDTELMKWEWLVTIPTTESFRVTFGPAITFVGILSLGLTLHMLPELRSRRDLRPEISLLASQGILSLYFLAFGWLPMPEDLYLMAAFDHVLWLATSLIIFSITAVAIAWKVGIFDGLSRRIRTGIGVAFLAFVVTTALAYLPFIEAFADSSNPLDRGTSDFAAGQVVDVARRYSSPGQRIGAFDRVATRSTNYLFPELELVGGRAAYLLPQRSFWERAHATLLYRDDLIDVPTVYFEDRPKVLPRLTELGDNYYPNLFWLDWYASSGPILNSAFYPVLRTALNYGARPQFFQEHAVQTLFGESFFFHARSASRSLIEPHGLVLTLPYAEGSRDPIYVDLLDLLSWLDLDSQLVVPVIPSGSGSGFSLDADLALMTYDQYVKQRDIWDNFMSQGGTLVVLQSSPGDHSPRPVEVQELGVSFLARASPLEKPAGASVIASSGTETVIYQERVGAGAMVMAGLTLDSLRESESTIATILLARMLGLPLLTEVVDAGAAIVSSSTAETTAKTTVRPGSDPSGGELVLLELKTGPTVPNNQVNLELPLSDGVPSNGRAVLALSVWLDRQPVDSIDVVLRSNASDGFLFYPLPLQGSSEAGWQDFSVPLAAFESKGEWKMGADIDQVELAINEESLQEKTSRLVLEDIRIVYADSGDYEPLNGEWARPNRFVVDVRGASRLLWKESFLPRWRVRTESGQPLEHHFAGPGMIYVELPSGVQTITFEMPYPRSLFLGVIFLPIGMLVIVYQLLDDKHKLHRNLSRFVAGLAKDSRNGS